MQLFFLKPLCLKIDVYIFSEKYQNDTVSCQNEYVSVIYTGLQLILIREQRTFHGPYQFINNDSVYKCKILRVEGFFAIHDNSGKVI